MGCCLRGRDVNGMQMSAGRSRSVSCGEWTACPMLNAAVNAVDRTRTNVDDLLSFVCCCHCLCGFTFFLWRTLLFLSPMSADCPLLMCLCPPLHSWLFCSILLPLFDHFVSR